MVDFGPRVELLDPDHHHAPARLTQLVPPGQAS